MLDYNYLLAALGPTSHPTSRDNRWVFVQVKGWTNEVVENNMASVKDVIHAARSLRTQYNLAGSVSEKAQRAAAIVIGGEKGVVIGVEKGVGLARVNYWPIQSSKVF